MTRPGGDHPVLPALLLGFILVATASAALLLPEPYNGPAALVIAATSLAAAYLVWPKPALLVFAIVMLFSRTLSRWLQPDLSHLDELVIPALIILAAYRTRPWQRRAWLMPVRDGALIALLALGVISALLAGVPIAVWGLALLLTVKLFAFFYVVLWHDISVADLRQAIPLVLGVALLVLVVGGLEAASPVAVRDALNLGDIGSERQSLPSIKSLLWHPSTFSWFSSFVAVFLFAGYVVLRRWWLLLGGLLFSAATVLGARRRALGGLFVALVGGFAASLGRGGAERTMWRSWIPVGLAGLLVALAFLPSLVGLARQTIGDVTNSGTARVALYNASVRIAGDSFPLGVGFGRFGSAPSRNPYSPVYAQYGLDGIKGLSPQKSMFVGDAFWARILGETGVLGLAALLGFCAALAVGSWRAARATFADPLVTVFVLGAWMAFVHTMIETLASSMFDSPTRVYLFFATMAVALALHRAPPETPSSDAAPADEPALP